MDVNFIKRGAYAPLLIPKSKIKLSNLNFQPGVGVEGFSPQDSDGFIIF